MSYTYPEALRALESIANDYIKTMRPHHDTRVHLVTDAYASTASVSWDVYGIRINMPVRPAASVMTQAEFEDWVAYLLHELGHPTHTDKAAWEGACRAGLSRLVNALEDVRMEKALIASGIVPNAHAVLSRLISRKVAEARANAWAPNARKEFAWTVCVLGRVANGYAVDADDVMWINGQIKPGSTVGTILAWALPELDACASTSECVALAQRIAKALASPQSNSDQDMGTESGKPEKQTSEAPNGPSEPSEDEGEGEGEGENANNEGDSSAGKGGKGHGDGTTDADETPVTDSDLVERELAPEGETMPANISASAEKYVLDILRSDVMSAKPRNEDETIVRKLGVNGTMLRDKAARASRQRALLARALRANETDEREGGRKAGRLDKGALSRAMAGAPNVFARRDISEGYDTDVHVLLDASGSMAGQEMISALEVGLIVAQAAGSVGASCTTEVFNSQGYLRAGGLASKRVPNPADYGVLVNKASGGTPLSAHMARAAVSQAKRASHKRRVLFVITDGQCDYGPQTVKRMATYLEQACGTVLAHVSIGMPLSGTFRAEVMVPRDAALTEVGLEHFVKVLQAL